MSGTSRAAGSRISCIEWFPDMLAGIAVAGAVIMNVEFRWACRFDIKGANGKCEQDQTVKDTMLHEVL
jgi:hypothetical protein